MTSPVTIYGKVREEWVVQCDGCRVRRFWVWDLKAFGTDFALCRRCFTAVGRIFTAAKTTDARSSALREPLTTEEKP